MEEIASANQNQFHDDEYIAHLIKQEEERLMFQDLGL